MKKQKVRQTVRQMGSFARARHSLGGKTLRATILLSVIVGVAAIAFGFLLYTSSEYGSYMVTTWNLSRSASRILEMGEVRSKAAEVLSVYDRLTEEERMKNGTPDYDEYFKEAEDLEESLLRWEVHDIQMVGNAMAGYIAALDLDHNRMVFIADGDQKATYCPPGYWDEIKEEYIDVFMNGSKVTLLDRMSRTPSMTAVVSNMPKYGYRCTAGTRLMSINGYPVFIFFDQDMAPAVEAGKNFLIQYIVLIILAALIPGFFILRYLQKKVAEPINDLAAVAKAYTEDPDKEHSEKRYFDELDIHTGDEIENLSLTMRDMENELSEYIQDLKKATAENERISTELEVSRRIQEGMVPHTFPAFPDRKEFRLYADMKPAKEVGGDFYDYFLIDEDHLALVMADVSGKGIPGALFMMASMILLKNNAIRENLMPADILRNVNNYICENNEAEMFVTVWMGILEISTGKLRAANAGHEYPVIRRANGNYELYKDKHGLVVGGMSGVKYSEYEIILSPGDSLFEYTDGVTEATSGEEELFGTDRLIDALNKDPDAEPEIVIKNVHSAIDSFVADAPQFDDITMLSFQYLGAEQ